MKKIFPYTSLRFPENVSKLIKDSSHQEKKTKIEKLK